MAKSNPDQAKRVSLQVSTKERAQFKAPLAAYVFNDNGELTYKAEVNNDKVELTLPKGERARVFVAPRDEKFEAMKLTPSLLERMGAYEPVLLDAAGKLIDRVVIPGIIIDRWPFCFCWVRGRVLRHSDNRAVCDARVHICEVDPFIWWIRQLPDADIYRLRDDLLNVIRNPPIPRPKPFPHPDPGPLSRSLFRFKNAATKRTGDPMGRVSVELNPQPLPPAVESMTAPIRLAPEVELALRSTSTVVLRDTLIQNYKLILPWLCIWPWWWRRFRCDEVGVLTTDGYGRFETTLFYPCGGDQPDLYFWVEYDFGSGFETVYHPLLACNTYWNYACGTEVTIRITDPRVPACGDEPDLPGCQVVVLSIGNAIAVRQVQTAGTEGLTTAGQPFGATLEPRVDFSRTCLIESKGIPYYRWTITRLSGTDGTTATVDPSSTPIGVPQILTRDVYRHYKVGTSYPSDLMGPMPTGPGGAPAPNLFRIRPTDPPAGNEWMVLNEHVDLATAYFDTASLAGSPGVGDDLAAGRYEMKLELFDAAGALVNWTAAGIDLRTTDQDAPFGTGTITTSPVPNYHRVLSGGNTMGFRMVVRVDNNRCYAEIQPVGGTVTPDPLCGFHYYNSPSDTAGESFIARHPNHFATYSFVTEKGSVPGAIGVATTSGVAGEAGTNGFLEVLDFTYSKNVTVSDLLGSCSNAAFSERLDVNAMAIDGYSTLTYLNSADNAAFALAVPCPPCDCGPGHGGGHGHH